MVLWEHVICKRQFWDRVGYTLDDTIKGKTSYGGQEILEKEYDPRRQHGVTPLGKCNYNFLEPLFWLQLSRILFWTKKKYFNP